MKKYSSVIAVISIVLVVFAIALAGCSKQSQQSSDEPKQVTLKVWNFTDELETGNMLGPFRETHPDIKIEFTNLGHNSEYDTKLTAALLAGGSDVPDVFGLDVLSCDIYAQAGLCLDISDVYAAYKDKLVKYQAEIGTNDGKVYALSFQATPGAYFYRRSLAKKYLGTDDPAEVQKYFADLNKFMETAKLLYDKSGGSCKIMAATGNNELLMAFLPNRKLPWVANGKAEVDPLMLEYMDMAKTMYDRGYDGRITAWTEPWFSGMKGVLKDENGKQVDIFGYMIPTWGLTYLLKTNAPETSGDWGMIPGPIHYYSGGTFLAANSKTRYPNAAKEVVRYLTCDDDFLEKWALERGDFTSNNYVNQKIKDQFAEPYLNGQNHWAMFSELAPFINGTTTQGTDGVINGMFHEALTAYIKGEKTKDKAVADFKAAVTSELGL